MRIQCIHRYLDNGNCKLNGDGCGTVEITLRNPVTGNGDGSGCDISLIPPLAFSDPLGFKYIDGCDSLDAFCGESGCNTAFYQPNDNCVQVACQENNVRAFLHSSLCMY
ncbi:uncharacterized protein FOMMEDRAFT_86065 [Fomitiporia mediterranea MF3/22]|uniref:uncharacterized protein n=1 Tax=Fomitiporia mediterranea (strain MF3/22) TaxID=694068 RepID=UPI000440747E|nr:uncharacterized protein FOMMEDRAFT_86065 [Fomitiporia mediterranea MF3/22]EJD03241.1 hypothetical protein FOMMEDRAFT_86065 [Fomitiporia mediterranea MF3/22]